MKRPSITYNLACTYAKSKDYDNALAEIEKVLHLEENWEEIMKDGDFKDLRTDPIYGPRLDEMVRKVESAVGATQPPQRN